MKIIALIFLSLSLCGCADHKEQDPQLVGINEKISSFMQPYGVTNRFSERGQSLRIEIGKIADPTNRRACIDRWVDELLSYDVGKEDFYYRGQSITAIRRLIFYGVHNAQFSAGESPEKMWDTYLRTVSWLHSQLERLVKDCPPTGMDGICITNDVQDDVFTKWVNCYNLCASDYDVTLQKLECNEFERWRYRGVSQETCDRLLKQLELFLGRPVRTPEQCRKDWRERRVEFPRIKCGDDPAAILKRH